MNQPPPLEVDGRAFVKWAVIGVLGFTLFMGLGTFGCGALWAHYFKSHNKPVVPPSEPPIHPTP